MPRRSSIGVVQVLVHTAALLLSLTPAAAAHAQNLFNAGFGSLPGDQGLSYSAVGDAGQVITNGAVRFDTSDSLSTHAGYGVISPRPLDRRRGVALLLTARLEQESHGSNTNRAGFSVILLGDDKRGIELGFWTNLIFGQSDSPLFTHAEDAVFNTTSRFHEFRLMLLATNYVLQADGATVLSGPTRDYTSFAGLLNPYRLPNFVFLGDDTASASAIISINQVALVTGPELTALKGDVIRWTGVSNQNYSVQTSTDLVQWSPAGSVPSAGTNFSFTNEVIGGPRFFQVTYP